MKSRKAIILIAIFLSVTIFSTGCANKIEEKIGEKIGEKILEKATDGEVSIDTKDGVSIEMEGGSMKTGENLDWPGESMGSLPKPKATIAAITEIKEQDSTSVILVFDKKDGASDYMEKLLDLGYIQRSLSKSDDHVMFMGVKDDNTAVMFNYQPNEEQGSITLMRNNDSAKEYFESEQDQVQDEEPLEIDMEKSMDWPKDSMDNIPPINAEITSVSINNDYVSISFEKIGKKDIVSYIEEIKSIGFDVNPTEMEMDTFISYSAFNGKEQTISINWDDNKGGLSYMKNN